MKVWCPGSSAESGSRVALQAENIEVARLNKVRIWGAMRRVARLTALGLDRLVLKDEGALLVHMARETDSIPRRG